jgi:hypothetical protein
MHLACRALELTCYGQENEDADEQETDDDEQEAECEAKTHAQQSEHVGFFAAAISAYTNGVVYAGECWRVAG